jgi:thioesterase domain-containing protein/acyl carrier protein
VVEVRDRFGDYGLVGVMIFGVEPDALVIDTLLLSCRVLGRGVEHAMVRALGQMAAERELGHVVAPFQATKKNLPARQFLESVEAATQEEAVGCARYRLSAAHAAALTYSPGALVSLPAGDAGLVMTKGDAGAGGDTSKSARWNRIALELGTPERILAWTERAARRTRTLSGEVVAPRTDLERRLAAIWAAVLGVPEVGVRDDYFELGGTSLLAATLFARIERELGRRLPLVVLLEAPTVEALAARLEQKVISPALVTLQEGGDLPPLFLVHDADGETLLYRNLAHWLGGRRPVYGVQPLAGEVTSMVHTRIEQMAAHYVAEIRRVQPRGPYLLGGLCAGGIVAFEMALQLEAANQEARLVAVLDAADVDAAVKPRLETGRRIQRLKEALRSKPLRALPRTLGGKGWGFLSYRVDHLTRRSRERLAVLALEHCLEWGWPVPRWARNLSVRTIYTQAEARYRPRGQVRGEIILFRATTGAGRDEPYREIYDDPLLGWQRRCEGGVRACDVPGGHGTMLQEPNVAELAAVLRSLLGDGVSAAGSVTPRVSEAGARVD